MSPSCRAQAGCPQMKPARAGPLRPHLQAASPDSPASQRLPPPLGACGRARAPEPAAPEASGRLPSPRVNLTHQPPPGSAPPGRAPALGAQTPRACCVVATHPRAKSQGAHSGFLQAAGTLGKTGRVGLYLPAGPCPAPSRSLRASPSVSPGNRGLQNYVSKVPNLNAERHLRVYLDLYCVSLDLL